jgi:hypothetical protein
MTTPNNADEQRWAARNRAYRAVFELARAAGAQPITRPAYRGSEYTVQDVDPLAGLTASRQLELAARQYATDYIRAAREAGRTWHDIGTALGMVPDADAQQAGSNLAEAAFTYAAGHPDRSFVYDRSITWRCGSCDQPITDHGLDNGPADNERGHADNCPQFAAAVDAWDAEWDATEADWEAGL